MKEPEIYTAYAPNNDITFIMRDTYHFNGELESTAVIGWYYGEPDEETRVNLSATLSPTMDKLKMSPGIRRGFLYGGKTK